ncbi:MAG TPA: hypothetical protein VEH08_05920, partial [Methanomassiliicoccales archaeon]|nr:hypothetical protein [Methanomassiliicoccales archaeon]
MGQGSRSIGVRILAIGLVFMLGISALGIAFFGSHYYDTGGLEQKWAYSPSAAEGNASYDAILIDSNGTVYAREYRNGYNGLNSFVAVSPQRGVLWRSTFNGN